MVLLVRRGIPLLLRCHVIVLFCITGVTTPMKVAKIQEMSIRLSSERADSQSSLSKLLVSSRSGFLSRSIPLTPPPCIVVIVVDAFCA